MKTEMKMIAAILAVLAVALGGVYVLDVEQADAADSIPAVWPGDAPAGATGYTFEPWMPDGVEKQAEWIVDEDYTYWLDTVNGADWITILGNTQVDFGGHSVAYRDKAIMPAGKTDPRYADVEIEFYNDYEGNAFRVDNTTVAAINLNDLSNCDMIETAAGTVYVDGLDVTITGRYYVSETDMTGRAYTKTISVPVLVQKINLANYDEDYVYTYNGLYLTPIAALGDNGNASDIYYYLDVVAGTKDADAAVPYAPAVDNNGKPAFEYPKDLADIVGEDEWVMAGVIKAFETNKVAGVETYIIEITAPGNDYVNGKITISWVILPLGLDDIQFNIKDPYYNFDQEVRPTVIMTWYEPEDGPNGAKVHYILPEKTDITYTMPEDYPYEIPTVLVPQFEVAVDPVTGDPLTEKLVMPKYEEAADDADPANIIEITDASGVTYKFDKTKPVYKTGEDDEPIQAVDAFGNPVTKQSRDEDGNLLWLLTNEDGETVDVHFRYSDMTFVYEKKIDADGNIVDDLDNPVMVVFKIPVYDGEAIVGMEEFTYYLKPATEPVYVQDTMEFDMPVYSDKPLMKQAVDEYGRPVYNDFLYNDLTYWDGTIVYEQVVKNGKIVYKTDDNGDKIPVKDFENPVKEIIYVEVDGDGKAIPNNDGKYVYVLKGGDEGAPEAIELGTTDTAPVILVGGDSFTVSGTEEKKYAAVAVANKYDTESGKVMVQVCEEVAQPFTATQVGVPDFYDGEEFVYGIRIVADTGYYEFDTNDYAPSYITLPEADDGNGDDNQGGDNQGGDNQGGDNQGGDNQGGDNQGGDEASDITKEIVGSTVPGLAYDMAGKLLYKPELTVIDENGEVPYLTFTGEVYDENKFTWSIKPLPFEPGWYDYETYEIVVPAGYATPDAYNSKGELIEEWVDSYGIVIPDKILDEDYTIVPLDYDPEDYDIEGANNVPPIVWPYLGQYDSDMPGMVEFPYGANFYNDMEYKYIGIGGMLNVDEVTVVDTLDADEVDAIKQAVHLFAMNLSYLKPFTVDDFNVTVLDGDGDLIVFQDKIVRTGVDSDMYAIIVTGNIENGYFGSLFGFFQIERGSTEQDVSVFEYKAVKGGVSITGYTGDAADVVIPDYIDGKKVVSIGEKAFLNNKTVKSVKMGNNVKTVGIKAFYGCTKLQSVEFSDSVKTIKTYAFVGCTKLKNVAFGHGLKTVEKNAFSSSLKFFYMGEDFKRGALELPPYVEISKDGWKVYANYIDESGKSVYLVDMLVGNAFVLGDEKGVLELYPPIDIDSPMVYMDDRYRIPCVEDESVEK